MEVNEETLRIFQQKSDSVSGTLSWKRDLSNMPRITQKLVSRYLMEGVVGGSLVKGGTKHKCHGSQLFKEQYMKKVFVKSNV